ncbi:phosphotransferase [Micromonospora endolithica]|uniref:Trifolitoxin immunity protein n=1 Tax=Micromonospora endolithica TaxID=230091 RepID=A0A3A9ZRM3_9ACTN|nr:phosphotransferase [Micromonospora endolithica]RKN50793.1 trifolitoxin immunity protein [Micromonospora endolithica]TWJ20448.1 phosphotransferase family enzyme [Micromonospora endolithica]
MSAEQRLPGGFVSEVFRAGDTVRRTPGPHTARVAALLRHLERVGADVAPHHLGYDERGREVLSHVDGRVPWRDREDPGFFADPALARLAALIRRLHDACAGTPLAGDAETVCHHDLSPKNTVYRDSPAGPLPVAFLDWDLARPGRRIDDVAFAAWHWAPLGPDADPAELGRRARLLCDAYDAADADSPPRRSGAGRVDGPGVPPLPRAELVDVALDQLDSTWRGIEAGARRGEGAMRHLAAAGVPPLIRTWHDWLLARRATVDTALHA